MFTCADFTSSSPPESRPIVTAFVFLRSNNLVVHLFNIVFVVCYMFLDCVQYKNLKKAIMHSVFTKSRFLFDVYLWTCC